MDGLVIVPRNPHLVSVGCHVLDHLPLQGCQILSLVHNQDLKTGWCTRLYIHVDHVHKVQLTKLRLVLNQLVIDLLAFKQGQVRGVMLLPLLGQINHAVTRTVNDPHVLAAAAQIRWDQHAVLRLRVHNKVLAQHPA